ncbi:MAG: peptidase M64 [Rikenellaceae bacterium]|nr:peptidase M64 [Rikenellaceae bacterium]
MKRILLTITMVLISIGAVAQNFDAYFSDNTIRLDYTLIGNAKEQKIALDEVISIEGWAGRRVNLDSVPVRGNGKITVSDPESGKTIYCNSFSTLFQEWLITDEAETLTKSFEATLLIPQPTSSVKIEIVLYHNDGSEMASFSHTLNPDDKLIRRLCPTAPRHEYLLESGTKEECIDVAIIAEGYTEQEMELFMKDARTTCEEILRYEPFSSMKERFNFVAVMLPSQDSGVSVPQDNAWRQTALGSHFMTFYSPRYLTTSNIHSMHDKLAGIPYEHLVILANTDTYGGGGIYNSYTLTTAHNQWFKPVVVHEFGHSFGALADEYFYEHTDHTEGTYRLDYEPWEQNISSLVDFESKWADMLPEGCDIPTKPTDKRKKNYTVGVYEGGGYITKGMYRPAVICRMRDNVATQFCPVCQRALERIIRYNTEEQ